MADSVQLIRYLRECYEADNRETGISNLLQEKYRHVTFLSGEELLLRGLCDRAPLDREKAEAAQKEAQMYVRDKTLVYGAFPLVGRIPRRPDLPSRLCAPLLFYPASIELEQSVAFVRADLSQQRVNFPVLVALAGQTDSPSALAEDLLGQLPDPPLDRAELHGLMALLMDLLPNVDAMGLSAYPELVSEERVRQAMRAPTGEDSMQLECLPACAVALVPNSPDTRGVLFELADMAERGSLSPPVGMVLKPPDRPPMVPKKQGIGRVPAVLSRPQQNVLARAASCPLTLVVGPPGTGKSYTIAAVALDHVRRGQSVLVASRMNHAVDVVARKIEDMTGPILSVVRGGRRQYQRELKKFLRHILHGFRLRPEVDPGSIKRLRREVGRLERRVERLEHTLALQGRREEVWGVAANEPTETGSVSRLLRWARRRWLDWCLARSEPLWQQAELYQSALQQRVDATARLLQQTVTARIQRTLNHHRRDLTRFAQAIKARSDAKQARLFSEIRLDVLFSTFPVWIVALSEISEVLPFESGLFDVAIIDEATQCDMASCLPVLQRARRAIVVGDPNQLRHVSFLSGKRQGAIAERHDLDAVQQSLFHYRDKSVLDLLSETITSQEQVVFLDEHFRSMPPIIHFSNREFYAGALKIMTQRPETAAMECVELHFVPDGRKQRGVNRQEAAAVVDAVARRVEAERDLPAAVCHSIGVLSPFRDQVDHLSARLQDRLALADLERHSLLAGTAHTFQGEERDVMFLSLVVDPQTHPATFNFLNNPNVFNVSITRARDEQHVFCSLRPEQVKSDSLLRGYLEAITRPESLGQEPSEHADAFLAEVGGELEQHGFRVWPAYPVAGQRIDLVLERDGRTTGIDLVGHPGEFVAPLDLERYRILHRAGLSLFPLTYRSWHQDRPACIEAIVQFHARS